MRDYIVTLLIFGSLPLILSRPFIGVLVWVLLGLMNPHRLCWGFAPTMPFAFIVAVTLLSSFLISKEKKQIPWTPLSVLLAFWWVWMLIASIDAADYPWDDWDKIWKIMLLTFVMIALLNTRERIHALVWVAVVSIGLYGVKGGIFTITSGGGAHVMGPTGTFIGGNNELGLALVMTIPLMRYLHLTTDRTLIKNALLGAMGLTFVAILGTQSRGALLGLASMSVYLALKSRNKATLLLTMVVLAPLAFSIMPESYFNRMETIETFQQDRSAMSRINAWWTAWYSVLDNPLTGSGFGMWTPRLYMQYAPDPSVVYDVHSIYFEVLGETGFVGFFLFIAIMLTALHSLNRVVKFADRDKRLIWMRDLASMVYVSIIGYAISGAFLGLAYFDYYYLFIAITVALTALMQRFIAEGVPNLAVDNDVVAVSGKHQQRSKSQSLDRSKRKFGMSDIVSWYRKL